MKFSVGYRLFDDETFINAVEDVKSHISELYFSFDGLPNGRGVANAELNGYKAKEKQLEDLKKLSNSEIKMNLLLNGNCYGEESQSRAFFIKLGELLEYLTDVCSVSIVTTTSPLIAKFVKQNFPSMETRASVNIGIGEIEGFEYMCDLFDSFYMKREYNRDLKRLKSARLWCDKNNKKLYGLANSGCLNFCSAHTFHDNLVAHEAEIAKMDNAYDFKGQCWSYLEKAESRDNWLRLTNFIRPEDVHLYEGIYDGLKLATRVSQNPLKIIKAYTDGKYSGSLPSLLEPNHESVFFPYIVENKNLPDNFAEQLLACNKDCDACGYCKNILQKAMVDLGE